MRSWRALGGKPIRGVGAGCTPFLSIVFPPRHADVKAPAMAARIVRLTLPGGPPATGTGAWPRKALPRRRHPGYSAAGASPLAPAVAGPDQASPQACAAQAGSRTG